MVSIGGGEICRVLSDYVGHIEVDGNSELKDYKFFCFDGKVRCFKVDYDRFVDHHANYYTPKGQILPFGEIACKTDFNHHMEMPFNLDEMITIAERLSDGLKFVRVDLYNISGRIYFGEMTFYPAGGVGAFTPPEWDSVLGSWIPL